MRSASSLALALLPLESISAGTEPDATETHRSIEAQAARLPLQYLSSGALSAFEAMLNRSRQAAPHSVALRHSTQLITTAAEPGIGANTPIGADPAELPSNLRAQAEPHIVRSHADPSVLVAVFQEGRYDTGAATCGYAVSNDGGTNWTRALVPGLTRINGGPFDHATDPVAATDLAGAIYVNTLGLTVTSNSLLSHILLSKSADGGKTFSALKVVHTTGDPNLFPDKNWIAVNTYRSTATAGRIAITFTQFSYGANTTFPILCTYSDDGGANWTAPKTISPSQCQGSQPFFLPDGSLACVYWNFSPKHHIEIVHSPDGGATFGAPQTVASVEFYRDPVARDASFLPCIATDSEAGIVYVVYQGLFEGSPRILFTRSVDHGLAWTAPKAISDNPAGVSVFNAAIGASPDGQHLVVIFYDKRHDATDGYLCDLYFAESYDAGATWRPNRRVSEVSTDLRLAPGTMQGRLLGDYQAVAGAIDPGTPAVAVWMDTRFGTVDPFSATIARSQGTTFDTWRRLRFSTDELQLPEISGPGADPDQDAIPNEFEYVLGLAPRAVDPPPFTLAVGPTQCELAVTYERPSIPGDRRIEWMMSIELGTEFVPVAANEMLRSGSHASRERIEVTLPGSCAESMMFFRPIVTPRNGL